MALATSSCRYAQEACFPEAPLPPTTHEAAPAPSPGQVTVQWYIQDGCWQVDRSWHQDGKLSAAGPVTDLDVLSLPAVPQFASMMYCIATLVGVWAELA